MTTIIRCLLLNLSYRRQPVAPPHESGSGEDDSKDGSGGDAGDNTDNDANDTTVGSDENPEKDKDSCEAGGSEHDDGAVTDEDDKHNNV